MHSMVVYGQPFLIPGFYGYPLILSLRCNYLRSLIFAGTVHH
jgi:hypothetical protein